MFHVKQCPLDRQRFSSEEEIHPEGRSGAVVGTTIAITTSMRSIGVSRETVANGLGETPGRSMKKPNPLVNPSVFLSGRKRFHAITD